MSNLSELLVTNVSQILQSVLPAPGSRGNLSSPPAGIARLEPTSKSLPSLRNMYVLQMTIPSNKQEDTSHVLSGPYWFHLPSSLDSSMEITVASSKRSGFLLASQDCSRRPKKKREKVRLVSTLIVRQGD